MARRSSARLRARNSATPQPTKTADLLQDGRIHTPKTAPQLAKVMEIDEMPGAFPRSASPKDDTPTKLAKHIADAVAGKTRTPKHKSLHPSEEEMHPQRCHASTSKPLDEARWLGFSEMVPRTEPPKGANKWAPAVDTPSKVSKHSETPPGPYEFTFRAQSLELSSEARQLMAEKREEAARIKKEMVRIEEEKKEAQEVQGRKIAQPKGKTGRFSEVHMAQFKKMDSIANHASAARPNSREKLEDVPALKRNTSVKGQSTSLKRSPSKAGLTQGRREDESKSAEKQEPTKSSDNVLRRPSPDEGTSPAKRVKLDIREAGPANLTASVIKVAPPSVQQQALATEPGHSDKITYPSLATPTKASIARAATVKATKTTMIPSLNRTPSKSASKATSKPQPAGSSLFARSPTKFAHMSAKKSGTRKDQGSPLLLRSPTKSIFGDRANSIGRDGRVVSSDGDKTPLLSRSPTRMPKDGGSDHTDGGDKTPLLSRSPARTTAISNPFADIDATPKPQTNLMDRFNKLRQSPIKSILRSPQRQYSDDPLKIANGTHLATPPAKHSWLTKPSVHGLGLAVPATEPISKHVDFTASTKSSDESPVPAGNSIILPGSAYTSLPSYPTLPSEHGNTTQSRAQRRQTLGPINSKDFTFRVGTSITFGPPPPSATTGRPSIRHVSADPAPSTSPSRKRKHVGEEGDDVFAPVSTLQQYVPPPSGSDGPSDKENDINTANIAAGNEASSRATSLPPAAKRARVTTTTTASTTTTAPTAKKSQDTVPSWAQGTAAQKARASIAAAKQTIKRPTTVNKARSVVKRAGSAVPERKERETSAIATASVSASTVEAGGQGLGGQMGKKAQGQGAGVISRARLDALSRPKRR